MINKSPKISFVFDRRKIATPTIKSSVELRVTYNYHQKFISTGIKLNTTQWKNGKIVNCPDVIQISQTLDKLLANVRQVILDMMDEGTVDISTIPQRLQKLGVKKMTFIDFCEQRATIRKFGKRKDTQERYERFIRLFKVWGKIWQFEDINEKNILLYDKYLEESGMKPYSKWNNYHRFLNSFIMDAMDEGYLKRNPYKWVNIDRHKTSKGIERYLTPEEVQLIKRAKLPTQSLEKVRDIFIFQIHTCLSYSDLKDFDINNLQEVKGTKVYVGNRTKTNKSFTIPILSTAYNILIRYKGKLPVISNVKYNQYLKVVAQSAGIDKPISSHWARHTGATLLLNEGVPMQVVSKICGHSSTKITEQVYAKLLDETVVDAVSELGM